MSRTEARRLVTREALAEQMRGVWFDPRLADRLRDEAPQAYKDIGAVMRAQRGLTRVSRRLEPVLVYKGG
jgi:tRNA-splicing ligase RtcB (3'-phosphate/5'-hydroxy nucleic acid ligase)